MVGKVPLKRLAAKCCGFWVNPPHYAINWRRWMSIWHPRKGIVLVPKKKRNFAVANCSALMAHGKR